MAFHFKTILFVTSLSLLLHTLLLYCPVDILFKSKDPLPVNGLRPQLHSLRPPANRLVLFIVNNATASDAYSAKNEDQQDLPFIRSVIRKKGRWGISYFSSSDANDDLYNNNNTRNSLPFLSGTYTSGNNEDTVLSSASKVWIWCSHDGSCLNNDTGIITHLFESPVASSNASLNWMSDHIENLFLVKGNEETVGKELMKDKTIFYFNFGSADLSSIDTAMQNISSFFDSYYRDKKTTFVFTASVLGNTTIESLPLMLPFVAWGAGIKNPRSKHSSLLTVHDEWSELWGLERFERVDLDQTDITPLLSVLIGTRIPLHSLGVLPVHYIHYNKEFFAEASHSNALQLLELVTAKEKSLHSRSLPFLFRSFHKLTREIKHKRKTMISSYIRQRKLQEALDLSMELVSLAKEAIRYYDVYHQLSVRLIMASLLLGWISYLVTILTRQDHDMEPADSRKRGLYYFIIIFSFIVGFGFLLWYQGMPPHFMLYFFAGLLLWSGAINNWNYVSRLIKESSKNPAQFYTSNFIVLISIAGIELIVLSFNGRLYLLSLLWMGLSLWPLITKQGKENFQSSLYWSVSCVTMTVYLSMLSKSSIPSILNTAVGLLVVALVLFLLLKPSIGYALTSPSSSLLNSKVTLWIQLLLLLLAIIFSNPLIKLYINTYYVKLGVVLMSLTLLLGLSLSVYGRLLQLGLFTLILFIISSDNNGSIIFFVLLSLCHYAWLVVEDLLINRKENKVTSLCDGVIAYTPVETPVLIPRNEISKTEYATTFRRAVIAFTMIATALHHLDSPNLLHGNQDELVLFSFQFIVLIIITLCCYNILGCLAKPSLLASLIILTVTVDLMPLHFLFFIKGTTIKDESLIYFYVSIVLAMLLPFLLLIVQMLTGRVIIPRKSDGLND